MAGALLAVSLAVSPLLVPGQVIVARDVPTFHLPLRTWFWGEAATSGALPQWNPGLHHGQPTLSNPNYAAFYPPSWLGLLLPPATALGWLIALHAVWGAAGAARLARVLGADRPAAAIVALAFGIGGSLLSLANVFTLQCGLAWLPWVVALGLEALAAPSPARCILPAGALALQLCAGEPVAVLLAAALLAILGLVGGGGPTFGRLRRLALIGGLAASLAAVQLIPTALRVADSPRAGGAAPESALDWSLPPERLLELVLPRFHGDPLRDEEGLYLGWGVNDRDYPYVLVLSPGVVLLAFGLAGLARFHALRRGLLLAAVLGLLLALGRHDPLYLALRELPPLAWIRYPEKWVLVTGVALIAAAGLGLTHWRRAGGRAVVVSSAALAVAVAAWWAWLLTPWASAFIEQRVGAPVSAEGLERVRDYLVADARVRLALLAALGGATLLRRRSLAAATLLVAALVAIEGGRDLPQVVATVPTETFAAPPPLADQATAVGGRVLTLIPYDGKPEVGIRRGPLGAQQLIGRTRRLDPYSGLGWGLAYSFHPDYDLMATRWASYAQAMFEEQLPAAEPTLRLAGAWGARSVVVRRELAELAAEARARRTMPETARLERNPFAGSLVFAAAEVVRHPDLERAATVARDEGWAPGRLHLGPGDAAMSPRLPSTLAVDEGADRLRLEWQSTGPVALVVARTFDPRWRAALSDGRELEVEPDALGRIAVLGPAEGRLELRFADPAVPVGAAITLLGLLACGALAWSSRAA